MYTCCDVISAPLRLSIANIQFFVINVHNSYHELFGAVKNIKHHQKRIKMSKDSKSKAHLDFQASIDSLKKIYADIQKKYEDPYMEKVRVHYPELYSALLKLRIKIENDKSVKDLLTTEL